MVSKEKLLILGFFVVVFFISSKVTGRDLAKDSSVSTQLDVFEENNDASGVKYNENISTRNNSVHPDWFIIPWIPKIPWIIPKIPWIPWLPMPGGGTPPGGGYGGPGEPSAPGGGYGEPPKEPSAPGGGYGGPREPSGSINPGQPGEPVEPGPVGPGEPPGKPGGLSEHGGSMTARMPRLETDRTPGGGSGVAGGGSPNGGIEGPSQKDYHGGHI